MGNWIDVTEENKAAFRKKLEDGLKQLEQVMEHVSKRELQKLEVLKTMLELQKIDKEHDNG